MAVSRDLDSNAIRVSSNNRTSWQSCAGPAIRELGRRDLELVGVRRCVLQPRRPRAWSDRHWPFDATTLIPSRRTIAASTCGSLLVVFRCGKTTIQRGRKPLSDNESCGNQSVFERSQENWNPGKWKLEDSPKRGGRSQGNLLPAPRGVSVKISCAGSTRDEMGQGTQN